MHIKLQRQGCVWTIWHAWSAKMSSERMLLAIWVGPPLKIGYLGLTKLLVDSAGALQIFVTAGVKLALEDAVPPLSHLAVAPKSASVRLGQSSEDDELRLSTDLCSYYESWAATRTCQSVSDYDLKLVSYSTNTSVGHS